MLEVRRPIWYIDDRFFSLKKSSTILPPRSWKCHHHKFTSIMLLPTSLYPIWLRIFESKDFSAWLPLSTAHDGLFHKLGPKTRSGENGIFWWRFWMMFIVTDVGDSFYIFVTESFCWKSHQHIHFAINIIKLSSTWSHQHHCGNFSVAPIFVI